MTRTILFLFLGLLSMKQINAQELFKEGSPSPKLLKILELAEMEPPSSSLEEINTWAQSNLIRKGERWEKQTTRFDAASPDLTSLLKDLGFVDEVRPRFTTYQGAIVYGALLPAFRERLHYLIEQWKLGVRFTHLYFLGGARPLEPHYENQTTLTTDTDSPLKIRKDWQEPCTLPQTETEMIQYIWDQAEVPEEMRQQLTLYFLDTPIRKTLRPTTDDTVRTWVATSPPLGTYLAVSNSPYIPRQAFVTRMIAPDYSFDPIGPAASPRESIAIFLDELARLIFLISKKSE